MAEVKLVNELGERVSAPVRTEVMVTGALDACPLPAPAPENEAELVENIPLTQEIKAGKWFFPGPGVYLLRDNEMPIAVMDEKQGLVMAGKAQMKWGEKKWALVAVVELSSAMPEQDARQVMDKRRRDKAASRNSKGGA